jgi:hypothetical protein
VKVRFQQTEASGVRRLAWFLFSICTWIVLLLVCVELLSFLAVSTTDSFFYGTTREPGRAVYDPYTLFLNQEGVRPTTNTKTCGAVQNKRVIWMFGGETLRGETDQDGKTLPSLLSGLLNAGDRNVCFTVVNFGEDSFNSLLETKYLQKILIESSQCPSLIVFYDGANESLLFPLYRTPGAHRDYMRVQGVVEGYRKGLHGLLKSVNAALDASYARELYDKIMQTVVPLDPRSDELGTMVALASKRYDYLDGLATCCGAKFVLFWQPALWVESEPVAPSVKEAETALKINTDPVKTLRHNFSTTYRALSENLAKKPYFVDLQNVLCARTQPVYQPDGICLNDDGRKIVAERMMKALEERGLAN